MISAENLILIVFYLVQYEVEISAYFVN